MLKRTMALTDLPYSVQLHCKTLFKTIDRDDDGVISLQELQEYYRDFICMQKECVEAQACAGYKAMTANGSYKLDMTVWGEMYANMLLGKQVYGPGEYIFGVFAIGRETEHFKLTMPSMEDGDEARSSKVNHVPHVPRKKLVIRS
ncbi:PREDICTED: uncharacterized protein LOC106821155 [Priapulus caudatus]|uniref:Uncharacterized protein LOC106821155 n=1 Tax=Priapulus caudatus TaxID=37621 RepID=A0ABM1FA59_PRICU|nr:PREDICTED: uncharacterized protein LOC106821155 [Priapulus caudatus]